jgi:CBS domain-containing protein
LFLMVGLPEKVDESLLDFTSPGASAVRLMLLNAWLAAFNLIPAFPMDGGRVLRAVLAMAMPYARATTVAALIGQGFAGVAAVIALVWFNPMLFLVALFVFLAARGESSSVSADEALRGVTLDQAMMTDFRSLAPDARLGDAVAALLAGTQHDFPVMLPGGGLAGILSRQALVQALAEHGPDHPIEPFLVRDLPRVFPGTPMGRAMQLLRQSPLDVLPVLSSDERQVVGLLSTENLGELLMVRTAVRSWNSHP